MEHIYSTALVAGDLARIGAYGNAEPLATVQTRGILKVLIPFHASGCHVT